MDLSQRDLELLRYAAWLYAEREIGRAIDLKGKDDVGGRRAWETFNALKGLQERIEQQQGIALQAFLTSEVA